MLLVPVVGPYGGVVGLPPQRRDCPGHQLVHPEGFRHHDHIAVQQALLINQRNIPTH